MQRAILYTRVSGEEQADNNSLPTQLAACRKYAEAQGLTVVGEYQDVMSGAKLNERTGLNSIRALIRSRAIEVLIVYSQDRLSRNLAHSLLLRDEFRECNITLHCVTKGASQDTPEGNLFDNIEGAFAEYERMKIRERMVRGKRGKAEKGVMIGHEFAPYGYVYAGDKHDKRLELREDEAAIMRMIGGWLLAGEGVPTIRRRLSDMRIPSPSDTRRLPMAKKRKAGDWSLSGLYGMLRNTVYSGTYYAFGKRQDRAQAVAITVPAIFDAGTWEAIQERLDSGNRFSGRNSKRNYLLRCRCRCGECGYSVSGCAVGKTRIQYYQCTNRRRTDGSRVCNQPYFNAAQVEAVVWGWINTCVLNEDHIRLRAAEARETTDDTRANLQHEQEQYYKQIADLESDADRIADLYIAKLYTLDQVARQKERIDLAITSTKKELQKVTSQLRNAKDAQDEAEELIAFVRLIRDRIDAGLATYEDRRRVIAALDTSVMLQTVNGSKFVDVTCSLTDDFKHIKVAPQGDLITSTAFLASGYKQNIPFGFVVRLPLST